MGIKSPSGPLSRKADLPHQLLTRATGKINRASSGSQGTGKVISKKLKTTVPRKGHQIVTNQEPQ